RLPVYLSQCRSASQCYRVGTARELRRNHLFDNNLCPLNSPGPPGRVDLCDKNGLSGPSGGAKGVSYYSNVTYVHNPLGPSALMGRVHGPSGSRSPEGTACRAGDRLRPSPAV